LHRAAVGDSLESAALLIKQGADCEARDLFNQTPLDLAKSNPMRRLLIKGRPPGALVSVEPKVAEDWAGSRANGVCIVFSNTVSDDLKTRAEKWLKKQKTKTVDCVDDRTTHLICRVPSYLSSVRFVAHDAQFRLIQMVASCDRRRWWKRFCEACGSCRKHG
jgi:hypothetical protein